MTTDTQIVELKGKHWLIGELFSAGLEVAEPYRDRGIDLLAYTDRGKYFFAVPIQIKAYSKKTFDLKQKYSRIPNLVIVYIWNLNEPENLLSFALTYKEAFKIASKMGYTATKSWKREGYTNTKPSKKLIGLLNPFRMNKDKWGKFRNSHS